MRRFLFILILTFLPLCAMVDAQEISNKERRAVNHKVLNLIEEYELNASLNGSDEIYSFLDLFKSQDSKVFCDLMGTKHYFKNITVREYVRNASLAVRDLDVEIRDVRRGEMTWDSGVWIIPVSFRKTISYVDENGVLFSAREFYENEDYRITMNVVYDPADGSCSIGSIRGRLNSPKTFPEGNFYVLKKNDYLSDRDKGLQEKMLVNGRPLQYNSFGQAIIPASSSFTVKDPDVVIDTNVLAATETYQLMNIGFDLIRGRFKARAAVAPLMAYNVKSKYSGTKATRSMAFEGGVDFGTTFVAGNAKLGVYAGLGLSMSNVSLRRSGDFSINNVPYFDSDKGYYINSAYSYTGIVETTSLAFKDIVIPVYLEAEHRVAERLVFTWNLGAKVYLPLSVNIGEYSIKGQRDRDDNIVDKEDIKVRSGFVNPTDVVLPDLTVSLMGNVGMDIEAVRKRLFITLKVGYEHGLMNTIKTRSCQSTLDSRESPPILYHPDGDYICHSPLAGLTLNRQAVWFDLGIKIKM